MTKGKENTKANFPITNFDRNNQEHRAALYEYVSQRLTSSGITKDEYKSLRDLPTVGYNSVGNILDVGAKLGYLEWRGGVLLNVGREISFRITYQEEKALQDIANEQRKPVSELLSELVREHISTGSPQNTV